MAHRTKILSGSKTLRGICSCGFTTASYDKTQRAAAAAELADHELEVINQADAHQLQLGGRPDSTIAKTKR